MAPNPNTPLPFADIYIDESSHTGHHYLVLGGIIAPTIDVAGIEQLLLAARQPELPKQTLKWTKVSRQKFPAYRRWVDVFFNADRKTTFDFHALVVDTHRQRHGVFNQGSQEIGFNKEIYQLALKFGRCYGGLFHIYPDKRTTNQRTEDLRLMLNRGVKKHYRDMRDWPYRRVQFREPEDSQLLQMADVFSGAIAWRLNGHHSAPGASPAKNALASHILSRAGVADVFRDTSVRGKFTIWHRQLKGVP